MSFRNNLQHLRSTRNMTQEQLAMLLGVSRQSVTKWEAEKSYPEMDKLIKLCNIFECSLDDLVNGDLTSCESEPAQVMPTGPATDVCGYDEHMRRRATMIAAGTSVIILGLAAMSGLEVFLGEAVPAIILFFAVAVGLGLVIPSALEHSLWCRQHPYIEDFYTEGDRLEAQRVFALSLVAGISAILAGVASAIVLENVVHEDLTGCIFLVFVAIGVGVLVRGGLMRSRMNLAEYNRDNADEMSVEDVEGMDLTDEERERLLEGRSARLQSASVCGVIMLVATLVGLLMLFAFPGDQRDNLFFLAWPVGGILCGIYVLVAEIVHNT